MSLVASGIIEKEGAEWLEEWEEVTDYKKPIFWTQEGSYTYESTLIVATHNTCLSSRLTKSKCGGR